ncbi:protein SPMIP9 [Paroedura picta]|uniref:protein SPMIP9 n=1 Tax=Paroedura picta TaxID=143630 RepID=UPI00405715D1
MATGALPAPALPSPAPPAPGAAWRAARPVPSLPVPSRPVPSGERGLRTGVVVVAGHLAEAVVEREVVADGVLPAGLAALVEGEVVGHVLVDVAEGSASPAPPPQPPSRRPPQPPRRPRRPRRRRRAGRASPAPRGEPRRPARTERRPTGAISSPLFRNVESVGREMGQVGQNCSLQRLVSLPKPLSPPVVGRSLDKVNLLSRRKFQKPTLKRNSSFRPLQEGNPCSMMEVMRRVSLSKPPVDMGMYRTLYMMDYQPYTDNHQWPHAEERLILDAQLKAKEFARPIKQEAVKYAEDPACQEVQPPSPTMMMSRVGRGSSAPQPSEATEKYLQKDFPAVLPSPQPSPPTKSVAANQAEEVERMSPSMQPRAVPGSTDIPCVQRELGQNWDNYQQFLLETQRAQHTQAQETKKLSLGCSVFPPDFISATDASTYQRDYKHWLRVRSGFCRAHRNFSNLLLEDGYYNRDPWMSDYMDNYSIFLQRHNWTLRSPASSFCSATKPVAHLSCGMPSQTPVAL